MRSGGSTGLDWLTVRPIAHRGLHDRPAGCWENTLTAARAALSAGFAIECDVQRSADGEAMVFHDFTLDRLTSEQGPVAARSTSSLGALRIGETADCIPTLPALLDLIGSRVPLVCEVKSAFDGDMRLSDRVAAIAEAYPGPLAVKSFDPAVVAHLRRRWPDRSHHPLGIVAESRYDDSEWEHLTSEFKRDLAAFSHIAETRPDYLSYAVTDLPHAASNLFRLGLGAPVITWTVRTAAQRETAARWADQIVFEGWQPDVFERAAP